MVYTKKDVEKIEKLVLDMFSIDPKAYWSNSGQKFPSKIVKEGNVDHLKGLFAASSVGQPAQKNQYLNVIKNLQESRPLVEKLERGELTDLFSHQEPNMPKDVYNLEERIGVYEKAIENTRKICEDLEELCYYNVINRDFTINKKAGDLYKKVLEVDVKELESYYSGEFADIVSRMEKNRRHQPSLKKTRQPCTE